MEVLDIKFNLIMRYIFNKYGICVIKVILLKFVYCLFNISCKFFSDI